ncbi:Muscle M-line assembly protein unc-89 [Trichinella pseudospiralis]|uniref:Muscle M-line assembly protein unc-89 n=1 Tax=Trichinella pseudospiralis TaxID=6337 RepID=A0A0V0YBN8_TRIPS|nr:Muscle M-line assembly protein unc-89 [Trichinella pseudospiralis]
MMTSFLNVPKILMPKSGDDIHIEVDNMVPSMLDIGQTFEEAAKLQQQHLELIKKLQAKQSNIEELLSKADSLVAQKSGSESIVYEAMADSLGTAWKDLNKQIQIRAQLLEQAVEFYGWVNKFHEIADLIEHFYSKLANTDINQEMTTQKLIHKHENISTELLETLIDVMSCGERVIERLREVGHLVQNTERIRETLNACELVEDAMLRAGERAQKLNEIWEQKKLQLGWSIQANHVFQKLKELEKWVKEKRDRLRKNDLGDSEMSSEYLLKDCLEIMEEAKPINESMAELKCQLDQLVGKGYNEAAELKADLENLSHRFNNICQQLENRKQLLQMAVCFFSSAATASKDLNKIEQEVRSMSLSKRSDKFSQLQMELVVRANSCAGPAIALGRTLLQRVSNSDSGVSGVIAKVEELDERLSFIKGLCKVYQEETDVRDQFYSDFMSKYNELYSWLAARNELMQNTFATFGSTQTAVMDFLDRHRQFKVEFQNKYPSYEAFLTESSHINERLKEEYGMQIRQLSSDVQSLWNKLQTAIEIRLRLGEIFLTFLKQVDQLKLDLNGMKLKLKFTDLDGSSVIDNLWPSAVHVQQQIQGTVERFAQESSSLAGDPNLDVKMCLAYMEAEMAKLTEEMRLIADMFKEYQDRQAQKKDILQKWASLKEDTDKFIDWIKQLQQQAADLFCVFDAMPDQVLADHEQILERILPQMKQAHEDLTSRLLKSESIASKSGTDSDCELVISRFVQSQQLLQNAIYHYEVFCALTTTFYRNLSQIDEWIEKLTSEFDVSRAQSEHIDVIERCLSDRKAALQTLGELLSMVNKEGEEIMRKAKQQNVPAEIRNECKKIRQVLEIRQRRFKELKDYDTHWILKAKEIQAIHEEIAQVERILLDLRSELDDISQTMAKHPKLFENCIRDFDSFMTKFKMTEDRVRNIFARLELEQSLSADLANDSKRLQDLCSELEQEVQRFEKNLAPASAYWKLVEETEIWIQEITEYIIEVRQRSAHCRTAEQVKQLSDDFDRHIKEQKAKQEERLKKIKESAKILHGEQWDNGIERYVKQYKEIIDSLSVVKSQLSNLKEEYIRKEKEIAALQAPYFTKLLESAMVQEGDKVELVCEVRGFPIPEVVWTKEGVAIEEDETLTISRSGNVCKLLIKEASSLHSAEFSCQAKKPKIVLIPPVFTKPLESATIQIGDFHKFNCHYTGYPAPSISWYKNGQPISSNENYEITFSECQTSLLIRKSTKLDNAEFSCVANNEAGEATTTSSLCIQSQPEGKPPVFITPLQDLVAKAGDKLVLECRVTGEPVPQLTWKFNDHIIEAGADFEIIHDSNIASLIIKQCTSLHGGTYSVIAHNTAGQATTACVIKVTETVTEQKSQEHVKPYLVQALKSITVTDSLPTEFCCAFEPSRDINIVWYKDGQQVKRTPRVEMLRQDSQCMLLISETRASDAGEYRCQATNAAGKADTRCYLTVQRKWIPRFNQSLKLHQYRNQFTTLRILCKKLATRQLSMVVRAVGMPAPDIFWYKDGMPVTADRSIQILKDESGWHRLVIDPVSKHHMGLYKVVAKNSVGEASCDASLQVNDRPMQLSQTMTKTSTVTCLETHSITTKISSPPTILRPLQDVYQSVGGCVILECVAVGTPKPKATWLFNDEPIKADQWNEISTSGDKYTLRVSGLKADQFGRYKLVLENEAGFSQTAANILCEKEKETKISEEKEISMLTTSESTAQPPHFVQPLVSSMVTESDKVYFEGIVQGKFPLFFMFSKQGWVLKHNRKRNIKIELCGYFCVTKQTNKSQKSVSQIITINSAQNICKTFIIVMLRKHTRFKAALKSNHAGIPKPKISWLKDGVKLDDSNVRCCIEKATLEHSGRYTCQAENLAGIAISSAVLSVKVRAVAPDFVHRLVSCEKVEGDALRWEAQVSGIPEPQVCWLRNNEPIKDRTDMQLLKLPCGVHILQMPCLKISDAAKFTIVAVNCAGEARSTADLLVRKQSDAPSVLAHQTRVIEQRVELGQERMGYRAGPLTPNSMFKIF